MKRWIVSQLNREQAKQIADDYSIPPIIAALLQIRGITTAEEIDAFFSDDNEMFDPFLITDMEKAAARIQKAINENELICVYGDFDADGVTSTALMYSYLSDRGANVMFYIPSREKEGYGINKEAIDFLAEKKVSLIITVDNGISAAEEIEYAAKLKIDTVITDHHAVPEILPAAAAVIDMHRPDCESPFNDFSGVGVVFKLIMALEDDVLDIEELIDKYSAVAALGTIGDVVPLIGENRILVKNGLQSIMERKNMGIAALLDDSGINVGNKLTAGRISYTIVPRINACGRLALSEKSVKLLLTDDEEEAKQIASELSEDNRLRQEIEKDILNKINTLLSEKPFLKRDKIIIIDGENWHQGVIGIVAARIKDIYGKPTIIISKNGTMAKGSGRSVKGFSIYDAIVPFKNLLTHFGGHPQAVGLSIETENIDSFRKSVNDYAAGLQSPPVDSLQIDFKLNPAVLNPELASQLALLEPYGAGNPVPLFGLFNMTLKSVYPVGGGKHLRLQIARDKSVLTAMLFFKTMDEFEYEINDVLDFAVTIDVNDYNGTKNLSVIVRDIKPANKDYMPEILSEYYFEDTMQGYDTTEEQKSLITPNRDDFILVYKFLRSNKCENITAESICTKINNSSINCGKLLVILQALSELKLVKVNENFKNLTIKLIPSDKKLDLHTAPIIKKLSH